MMTLEPITAAQLGPLHRRSMRRDFPRNELRSLAMVRSMVRKGNYQGVALREDGKQLAYAFLLQLPAPGWQLLDYFAVEPALRGQGMGQQFLARLRQTMPGGGMLIEAENPAAAQGPEEEEVRRRRVDFYRRCGAVDLGLAWHLFGVEYRVLCLAGANAAPITPAQGGQQLVAAYRAMVPPAMFRRHVRLEGLEDGTA